MTTVTLSHADLAEARDAATASLARFQSVTGYYANTWVTHLIGRIGELAAERVFVEGGWPVVAHWRNPEAIRLCDLEILGHRLEVKTWNDRFWCDFGRCVAVGQLEALAQKAGVILWATVDAACTSRLAWEACRVCAVTLRGYSTLPEVRAAPVRWTGPAGRQVENYQLDEAAMRSFEHLVAGLTRTRAATRQQKPTEPSVGGQQTTVAQSGSEYRQQLLWLE